MVPFKSNDHWAFLEEIEAPMWVDLTLEEKSNVKNVDDKWFSVHHPIHQCSSHDLKAAFSQLFEDHKTIDFELSVSCSPNFPDSVSKSRGKDYDSKKWRGSCQDFAIDKHVISEKLNSGSATKWKMRSSFIDSKETSSSKLSLVHAIKLTKNGMSNISNHLSNHGDSATGSSSQGKQSADSRSSSTITTDKPMDVTSQPVGTTSSLISVMRRSLRKTRVYTRQASRGEVNYGPRLSSGHKSSSSKSSINSSGNPRFDVKSISSTSEQHRKKTRDARSFTRMTQAAMNKTKNSCVSSILVQVEDMSSNSRTVGKFQNAKSGHLEASKPKMVRAKTSLSQKRDEQNVCVKPKKKVSLDGTGRSRTAVVGKENAMVKIGLSQKSDGRDIATESKVKDQKRTQRSVTQRVGRQSVVSSKQGRNCHPSEGRNMGNANHIYLR